MNIAERDIMLERRFGFFFCKPDANRDMVKSNQDISDQFFTLESNNITPH